MKKISFPKNPIVFKKITLDQYYELMGNTKTATEVASVVHLASIQLGKDVITPQEFGCICGFAEERIETCDWR